MKKFKSGIFISAIITIMSMFFVTSVSAAGTNVSSGFSLTIGSSHTNVQEWGDYRSRGCGVSVSYDHNSDGFDYRSEHYRTQTNAGSEATGSIYGQYVSVDHTSSAGILRSSTGLTKGFSVAEFESSSWGETNVNGSYTQISAQSGAYNYEHGTFSANSGYETESNSESLTAYVNTYSNTEFDY